MQFVALYTQNGKQIFPKNGMTIPVGTMVLTPKKEFVALNSDYKYLKKSEWNNLCQTREVTEELVEIKE